MARLFAELASRIRLADNAIHTLDREPETGTAIDLPGDQVGRRSRISE
jgi:hypothetical protein